MSGTGRFREMKMRGEKIAVLTAYDAPTARIEHEAGVDLLLVGDSVGTTMLGYASEREVTLDDMAHHVSAVRRGAPQATILADLPFASYETVEQAIASGRVLQKAGADMVKLEGPRVDIVSALHDAGIAVSGHLGLEPQHHEEKRLKAKTARDARALIADAERLDEAGMDLLVLELIPAELASRITAMVSAPTIGIGAGAGTDGQVLVVTDAVGLCGANFRHNRRFAEIGSALGDAVKSYRAAVRDGSFPTEANSFRMPPDELARLDETL